MRKNRIAIAVTAGALLGLTGMSGAADAARCGGQPDGIVDPGGPGTGTWDSPGEVISYFQHGGRCSLESVSGAARIRRQGVLRRRTSSLIHQGCSLARLSRVRQRRAIPASRVT